MPSRLPAPLIYLQSVLRPTLLRPDVRAASESSDISDSGHQLRVGVRS